MRTPTRPAGFGSTAAPTDAHARDGPHPSAHRNLVLVLLTMVSACADAISYLGLGHVFPANMTGNTVLLGIGIASRNLSAATRSATALGAFLLGAAAAGAANPTTRHRPARLAVAIGEVMLMATFCGWWLSADDPAPTGALRYGLIALVGASMGAQSGLVRQLDAPVATTYITGTWTALSAGVANRLRGRRRGSDRPDCRSLALQAVVVGTYLGTAFAAAFAYRRLGGSATALPLGILLMAVLDATIDKSALGGSLDNAARGREGGPSPADVPGAARRPLQ